MWKANIYAGRVGAPSVIRIDRTPGPAGRPALRTARALFRFRLARAFISRRLRSWKTPVHDGLCRLRLGLVLLAQQILD